MIRMPCKSSPCRQLLVVAAFGLLSMVGSLCAEPAQLHLITDPRGATIAIDGEVRGTAPITISNLSAGKHLLVVEKHNYESVRQTLELTDGETAAREIHLTPIYGLVLITSEPTGADVAIDGAHRGTTPTLITDLPLGRYRAELVKPSYISREIEVHLDSRRPKEFAVKLTSDSATLSIESEPSGAEVTINGIARGTSPCKVERIPSGDVTLELKMDGYKPYSESLRLSAGENQQVSAVLKAIPSDLTLVSIPGNARMYVNDQFRGLAPVELNGLEPGTYRIRAELPAYDIMLRSVTVGLAQSITEEFRLKANAGWIEITTEPADVKVLLDGKEVGTTTTGSNATDRISQPLSVNLIPSGAHILTLTKAGFYDVRAQIDVAKESIYTEHFRLKRRFIPNYEVKTRDEVYRGVLVEVDAQRNVQLETHPGIFKTLKREDIISAQPLREEDLNQDL